MATGGGNRARPLWRPGINAGPGRLRPTSHEWDATIHARCSGSRLPEPEACLPDFPAPAPLRHPQIPGDGATVSELSWIGTELTCQPSLRLEGNRALNDWMK